MPVQNSDSNLHFSYVLVYGLLEKIFGYYPKMSKLKILYRNACLSKKEVLRKLPVQKKGRTCPGYVEGQDKRNLKNPKPTNYTVYGFHLEC